MSEKFLESIDPDDGDCCFICRSDHKIIKCRETTINNIIIVCSDCLGFMQACLRSLNEDDDLH
jgi:hypothetical protein